MKNPPLHRYATRPGLYFTDDGGADAVVRSETADQVWFCVLEPLDQPSAFYADAVRLFNEPGLTFIDQAKKQRICTRRIPSLNLRETLFRMDGPNYGLWYVHVPQAWDGMQYGYRVNVVDHEDGRRAYEEYRQERGHPLHFAESDEFRHAFEREYIARLYNELPPERRPNLEARIGADYFTEIRKMA